MSLKFFLAFFTLLATLAYALFKVRKPLRGFSLAPKIDRIEITKPPKPPPTKKKAGNLAEIIREIPKGRVITFTSLADRLGQRTLPVQISKQVRSLAGKARIPWWRVVRKDGQRGLITASKTGQKQRELLENEGVAFHGRSFHLADFEWKP